MFSPYVVVPDPPPSPATVVASPSASSARPVSAVQRRVGQVGDAAHVADVLGDEHEHHRHERREDRPGTEVGGGEVREPDPRGLLDGVEVDLARQHRSDVPDHHAEEDRQPGEQPAQRDGPEDHRDERDQGHPGCLLEVRPGHGCEVEADQGDDRARHDGRHQRVDPPGAGDHDDRPDDCQQDPDDDEAEQCAARAVRRRRRGDRGDERERRPEIARQPVAGDDQEEQGADAGEEQGRGGREAGQERHQEGGAEHRHHVLHTEADGGRPGQPLVGADDLALGDGGPVPVYLPAQRHVRSL